MKEKTFKFYVMPGMSSFQEVDAQSVATLQDAYISFYDEMGGHSYFIHYIGGKAAEILVEEEQEDESHDVCWLEYDDLDDNYWTTKNLSETMSSEVKLTKVGIISEGDFRPMANMFLTDRALDYANFESWLNETLSLKIPNKVVAFNFNLYEDTDMNWSIELVGATKTEEEDEDWACYDDAFNNRETPLIWQENTEWPRIQAEAEDAIRMYLEKGKYAEKLKEYQTIGVGFVSGDITILYKGIKNLKKKNDSLFENRFYYLAIFIVAMVPILYFLPNNTARNIAVLVIIFVVALILDWPAVRKRREMRNSLEETALRGTTEEESINSEEIEAMQERVRHLLKATIQYSTKPFAEQSLPIGCSKFGGQPDVPVDFIWPRDDAGFPLALLLQINCADLGPYDTDHLYPTSGHLYFFYELKKQDWTGMGNSIRVLYNDEPVKRLRQMERPKELEVLDSEFNLRERALKFCLSYTVPTYTDLKELLGKEAEKYDKKIYEAMRKQFWNTVYTSQSGIIGSLGGYAEVIQSSMLSDIPEDDVLLMQMFSFMGENGTYDMTYGDLGNIYFYINREDLVHRDFSHVYFELQCE